MLTQKPSMIKLRTIFKPLIPQTHAIRYVNGLLSDVKQANTLTTPYTTVTVPVPEAHATMHYLDGIILLIDHFSWYFKLICEHLCKFEQMNKTICDHTQAMSIELFDYRTNQT